VVTESLSQLQTRPTSGEVTTRITELKFGLALLKKMYCTVLLASDNAVILFCAVLHKNINLSTLFEF
jgi:hypothetical protein